jgi:hypothetical protein
MKMCLQMLLCQQALEFRQLANATLTESRIGYRYLTSLSNIYTFWADKTWGLFSKTIEVDNVNQKIDGNRIVETNKLLRTLLSDSSMQAVREYEAVAGIVKYCGDGFEQGGNEGFVSMTCGKDFAELPALCGVCGGGANQIVRWCDL